MAAEMLRGYDFIYTALTGDATLSGLVGGRIFNELALQATTYPFVLFSYLGGSDRVVLGGRRLEAEGVYLVKVVDRTTSYGTLRAIADRIDTILHGRKGAAGVDGVVWACTREALDPLPPEVIDGVQFRQIAGRYRLFVQV